MSERESGMENERPHGEMNAFTNFEGVLAAMVELEANDKAWEQQQHNPKNEYGLTWATANAKRDPYGQVVNGLGGISRYYIRPDGRVDFSREHSPTRVAQAETFGFRIEG